MLLDYIRGPKWSKFSSDLRGQTVAELKQQWAFTKVGTSGSSEVCIRPEDAPQARPLERVKISDLPDDAIYFGQSGIMIPTFVRAPKQ